MKSNVKFFTGLTCGLVLGILFFNTFELQSKVTPNLDETGDLIGRAESDPIKGEWISPAEAEPLVQSYISNVVEAENSITTKGGWIGKKHLRDISGLSANDYVQFKFYHTTDESGNPQIGIIFYDTQSSENLLRTGSGSFCPMICDYPEE